MNSNHESLEPTPVLVLGATGDQGGADVGAMWEDLRGPGYHVDINGFRTRHPSVRSTSFADWAGNTFAAPLPTDGRQP